jgi:hypothetical protein
LSELAAVEREWAEAIAQRDVEAAERLLADDFRLSSSGGVAPVMPRETWLATLPSIETRSLRCEVIEERVFDSVAVVQARLSWDGSLGERDLSGEYAVADVFTRAHGRWQASWRVSARLPSASGP